MKEIIVKNNQTADARIQGEGENQFVVRQIIDDVDKCSANFVEVLCAPDSSSIPAVESSMRSRDLIVNSLCSRLLVDANTTSVDARAFLRFPQKQLRKII